MTTKIIIKKLALALEQIDDAIALPSSINDKDTYYELKDIKNDIEKLKDRLQIKDFN